jgi:hypothetical protein
MARSKLVATYAIAFAVLVSIWPEQTWTSVFGECIANITGSLRLLHWSGVWLRSKCRPAPVLVASR